MQKTVATPLSPQVILLAVAAAISVVWDLGYTPFSLESGIGLVAGLALGIAASLATATSERARAAAIVLLFLCMFDIYFLQRDLLFCSLAALACAVAFWRPTKIPGGALVVCALVFAGSLLLPGHGGMGAVPVQLAEADSKDESFLIHLMMDELGAFDSVPVEHRNQEDIDAISAAYRKRGFQLHDGLESLTPDTHRSMGVLMDVSLVDDMDASSSRLDGLDSYRINSNQLHSFIASHGWNVTIVQSWYLDYCGGSFECYTYTLSKSFGVFEHLDNLRLRLAIFGTQMTATLTSRDRGSAVYRALSSQFTVNSANRSQWRNPTLPLVAAEQLEFVRGAIVEAKGRQYVFSHILSPHFPWILDPSCKVKDLNAWRLPYTARRNTTPSAREDAFKAYWDQTVCAHRTLLSFVDSIDQAHPGRARFVIHGDHGPRIMARRIEPDDKGPADEQTRRNVLSPFVATRVHLDTSIPDDAHPPLQVWLSEVLRNEATLPASEVTPEASSGDVTQN